MNECGGKVVVYLLVKSTRNHSLTHTHTPACAQKRFVKRAAARWVITRHHFPSAFFCEWSSLCMQPPRSSIHKQRSLLFPAACVDPTPTQRKWPQTVKRMDYKMDGYLDQQVPYPLANVRMSQRFLLLYSINVFVFLPCCFAACRGFIRVRVASARVAIEKVFVCTDCNYQEGKKPPLSYACAHLKVIVNLFCWFSLFQIIIFGQKVPPTPPNWHMRYCIGTISPFKICIPKHIAALCAFMSFPGQMCPIGGQ